MKKDDSLLLVAAEHHRFSTSNSTRHVATTIVSNYSMPSVHVRRAHACAQRSTLIERTRSTTRRRFERSTLLRYAPSGQRNALLLSRVKYCTRFRVKTCARRVYIDYAATYYCVKMHTFFYACARE